MRVATTLRSGATLLLLLALVVCALLSDVAEAQRRPVNERRLGKEDKQEKILPPVIERELKGKGSKSSKVSLPRRPHSWVIPRRPPLVGTGSRSRSSNVNRKRGPHAGSANARSAKLRQRMSG